jgi:putative hydroxymethylpyrimidine transport system permease protein
MSLVRGLVVFAGLVVAWQALVWLTGVAPYILPGPLAVARALTERWSLIAENAGVTILEIVLGLAVGTLLGVASALLIAAFRPAREWLLPVLVVSQAVPVFALAPLLVLWFGYGLASKVAMATLIIYFPVTAAFTDGLRRTEPGWLDLARTMGGDRLAVLRVIRVPAALPALASGLRVATAVAPIGAVVGEWVGASAGLGYLMLHANARLQVDLMFAALFVLAVFAVLLYFTVDRLLRLALPWQAEQP